MEPLVTYGHESDQKQYKTLRIEVIDIQSAYQPTRICLRLKGCSVLYRYDCLFFQHLFEKLYSFSSIFTA